MLKTTRIFCELLGGLVALCVTVALSSLWYLSTTPLRSSIFTPAIEQGLERLFEGTEATIATTMLSWENASMALSFHADDITLRTHTPTTGNENVDDGANIVGRIPSMGVQIDLWSLFTGQFLPRELMIDHPQFVIHRAKDGQFYLAPPQEQTSAPTPASEKEPPSPRDSVSALAAALTLATHHLSQADITKQLTIRRTVIEVVDDTTSRHWAVEIPEITLERTEKGLLGHIALNVTQGDHSATLHIGYQFDRKAAQHTLTSRFDNITPAQFAGNDPSTLGLNFLTGLSIPLTGEITATTNQEGHLLRAQLDLTSGKGVLNLPLLWDKPRSINSFSVLAHYATDTEHSLSLTTKADINGTIIAADLHAAPTSAMAMGLDTPLTMKTALTIDHFPLTGSADIWPKTIAPDLREWITGSLSQGTFDHVEARMGGTVVPRDIANFVPTELTGRAQASNATIDYITGMPPAIKVGTTAEFDINTLRAHVTGGQVEGVTILPFDLSITGLMADTQFIALPIRFQAKAADALRLIDHQPLGYATEVGLTPTSLTSDIDGIADLTFPLLKDLALKDMGISVKAKLNNLTSSTLVEGFNLSKGQLNLVLDKESYTITGGIHVNATPTTIAWRHIFSPAPGQASRQLTLAATMEEKDWPHFDLTFFQQERGQSKLNLNLRMTEKSADPIMIDGTLDMKGAEIVLPILNWRKPQQHPTQIAFTGSLSPHGILLLDTLRMEGKDSSLRGTITVNTTTGTITDLNFSPIKLGRSDANLSYTIDPQSKRTSVILTGKSFDITGLLNQSSPLARSPASPPPQTTTTTSKNEWPDPFALTIDIANLYTSENSYLSAVKGKALRDAEGWDRVDIQLLAQGQTQASVTLLPLPNTTPPLRQLQAKTDNFGNIMRGLGFGNRVHGGTLSITGQTTASHLRQIDGTLSIQDFSVHDLPVLVRLLNLLSPLGFLGLITNQTDVNSLKGRFSFNGPTINITKAQLNGKTVVMNIEGTHNPYTNQADLKGTVVPFSTINRILSIIPIIGDLLTGGDDNGLLAVNYAIHGDMGDPKVDVYPTSLLTPGFLRNLFFGDDDATEGAAKTSEQATTTYPQQRIAPVSHNNLTNGQKP